MEKKIIVKIAAGLGNQMFMYASAYSISKELNRKLYIDNETAFTSRKNVSKYGLNLFSISSPIAPDNLKYKNLFGYIKKKFLFKTDFLRSRKSFYIEKKDRNKVTKYIDDYRQLSFDTNLFLEGHFESEKYFKNYKGILNYIDEITNFCKKNGFVKTIFGRKCYIDGINSSNPNFRNFAIRAAVNAPIQGSAADIIKKAMINIDKFLEEKKTKSKMILQVHDELLFEMHESEINYLSKEIKKIMENKNSITGNYLSKKKSIQNL